LQHGRSDRAVRSDRGDVERGECGRRGAWFLTAQSPPVVAEGELGNDGQVALREGDGCGLGERLGVAEGLQDGDMRQLWLSGVPAREARNGHTQRMIALLVDGLRYGAHRGNRC
jgi:hypothetical protein